MLKTMILHFTMSILWVLGEENILNFARSQAFPPESSWVANLGAWVMTRGDAIRESTMTLPIIHHPETRF